MKIENDYQNIIIKGYVDENGQFKPGIPGGTSGGGSAAPSKPSANYYTTSGSYNTLTGDITYTRNDGQTYKVSLKPLKDVLEQEVEQAKTTIIGLQAKDVELQKEIDKLNMQVAFQHIVGTKAELPSIQNPQEGEFAIVFSDESKKGNMSLYTYKGGSWTFLSDKEPTYAKADIDALETKLDTKISNNQGRIATLSGDIQAQDLQIGETATKTNANTSKIETIKTDLANKLDLDLGNVDTQGFLEKLQKAQVLFKGQAPQPTPTKILTTAGYQEIHENESHDLTLPKDVNKINLQIDTEGQPFEVTIPESEAGTIIILGGIVTGDFRGQVVVRTAITPGKTPWQIQGGSDLVIDNVKQTYYYLISTGSEYLATPLYDEFEEGSSEVTINDMVGGSVKGTTFTLGRGLTVNNKDKGSSTSFYEDEISTETYSQLEERSVIDLAPQVFDELIGNDGFYAKLGRQEELVVPTGKNTVKAKLYPEDVIVDTKGYIQVNKIDKSFGIQDALQDDPNISGGQPAVVASILSMYGVAPEDGTVTFYIYDEYTKQPVMDIMGKPMQVSRNYKAGDKLGTLHLEDVVMDKGVRNISLYVEPTFKTDSIVVKENTCLMIQYITDKHQTGEALRTFEQENGINLTWYKEYVGKDFFTLGHYLDEDVAETELNAGDGMLGNDGVQFYAATKLKASIKDRVMDIKDNGKDIAYFNIGRVLSPEETILLEDGEIDVDVVTKAQNDAFNVYLVGTKLDNPGSKIFTGQQNDQPILENGWEIISDNGFISSDVTDGFKGHSFNYFIPLGYKQVGVIIAPEVAQMPLELSIQKMSISSAKNRMVWFINKPTFQEDEYKFYNDTAIFDMNTGNRFAALRYTINSKPTKIPVGATTDKDITNVMAWKDSGYAGEGVIEAKKDIVISNISVKFDRTLYFGEKKAKGKAEKITTFFTIGNDPSNPIRETEDYSMFTDAYPPNTQEITHETPCNIKLNKGQDLWFWAQSLVDDGLYVQAPTNGVLLEIAIKYEEVKKI